MPRFFAPVLILFAALGLWAAGPAQSQAEGPIYLQIEAHPTLAAGTQAAQGYAAEVGSVSGHSVAGGWYAITIGPFVNREEARAQLLQLRARRAIPADSFLVEAERLGNRFYPVGAAPLAPATVQAAPAQTTPAPAQPEPPQPEPEETLREARANEARLTGEERRALQEALQWDGFYTSAIDGAFGPGTRRAMAAWQEFKGLEPTGVLTTRQRAQLLGEYRAQFERLGLASVYDDEAGVEVLLPLAMIERAEVEPPFVRYRSSTDDGVEALLISQEGDRTTLFGLYDIMQTLEIVPLEGERTRGPNAFTLTGQDATRHSYTYATVVGGAVKGFTLVWRPEDARVMNRIVQQMRDSFTAIDGVVLPDAAGAGQVQSIDLVAGLEIRRPVKSRSAFWVDATGRALTTTDLTGRECGRYTLAGDLPARIAAQDDTLGLVLLEPADRLAPPAIAGMRSTTPLLRSEIAVGGYSYEGRLELPSLTFGTLEDVRGLGGEENLHRLEVDTLTGDAGGPVFDMSGAVAGLLQADATGSRALPGNVRFAVSAAALSAFLDGAGVGPRFARDSAPIAPEDLSTLAADTVVLASCWE